MVDRTSPPGRPSRPPLSAASTVLRLAAIAVVVAAVAGAFAYVTVTLTHNV
jgi:catalase